MGTGPRTSPDLSIGKVWGDAWAVYKLLFRRSVLLAVLVYAVLETVNMGASIARWSGVAVVPRLVVLVAESAGPVLVQGALVLIVCDIHEGTRPRSLGALLAAAWKRILSLTWASIVYTFGSVIGLLLLVVPGLLVISRWSLMVPLVMLEGDDAGTARHRSSGLVAPRTWPVLVVIVATFLVTAIVVNAAISPYYGLFNLPWWCYWPLLIVAHSVTAPFEAHVLTVLYYRFTDPDRPVIHPDVRTWRSVWKGA